MPLNSDTVHLARLRDHYARHGTMPSYAGIGEVVGFKAKNAAVKLAKRLAEQGFLKAAPGGKLAPTARFFELPMVDAKVRAGTPEAVGDHVSAELVTLDGFLVSSPSNTVLVRVKGDSMIEAGILDGDLAVVERSETARSGEFVVAVIDDEFTLKELHCDGRRPLLVPHNAKYSVICPSQTLQIFGIVRGVVRRYADTPIQSKRQRGAAT